MRTLLLTILALGGLLGSGAVWCEQQGSAKRDFSVRHVAGNIYMLASSNGGSNVAAVVGTDGLILVDANMEPAHQSLLAALRQISDKPVRYIIDTHCHADHTWGNAAFQREGATVIAHRNVRERLAVQSDCGPRPGTGLPTVTFDNELTLFLDDEEIHIIKLPTGHTDGDCLVYFKKANVVETGDAYVSVQLPGPSKTQNGTMSGVIDELHTIVSLVPEDAKVIPGHGAQASISDVRRSARTLEEMRDVIQQQVRAGKSLDEMRTMNLLSRWNDIFGPPCAPNTPCDHLGAEYFLRNFYRDFNPEPVQSNANPNQPKR